ncbi:DUF975 family protein [Cytobacillus horneckiae]|uniref:DUF975 family protein n=1 Tax=Cytobacillus horneckiae TaxID=549687 RepID=UPI003D9A9F07
MNSKQIKQQSLQSLKGNWGIGALFTFIYFLISSVPSVVVEMVLIPYPEWEETLSYAVINLAFAIILLPFAITFMLAYLTMVRDSKLHIGELFTGFKYFSFFRAIGISILQSIYIFFWTLLLIIPGIIKGLAYSQAVYILRDHPELSVNQAITESRRMMHGHKWRYFVLNLSFIGWAILGIFTLGIGYLWLSSYFLTAHAHFYEDLKTSQAKEKQAIV